MAYPRTSHGQRPPAPMDTRLREYRHVGGGKGTFRGLGDWVVCHAPIYLIY